jgi:hypothetical protein
MCGSDTGCDVGAVPALGATKMQDVKELIGILMCVADRTE